MSEFDAEEELKIKERKMKKVIIKMEVEVPENMCKAEIAERANFTMLEGGLSITKVLSVEKKDES